jgi:iron complex transport system ATP-binding protein
MNEHFPARHKVLEIKNLSLGYDKTIYSGINATASDGEMIAIIGANGTGKSTLLRSISGILPYREGSISIFGKNINQYKKGRVAGKVSFLPSRNYKVKNYSLFDMLSASCYQRSNWIGSISPEDSSLIYKTMDKVGLRGFAERDITTLSDGEFQRASIAGSLVQNSPLILLDEPTAFLDIANKITITRLLREISSAERKTILFSTHDLAHAIKSCDKIWIMGYKGFEEGTPGELIEKGAFDNVFKDSGLKFDTSLYTYM